MVQEHATCLTYTRIKHTYLLCFDTDSSSHMTDEILEFTKKPKAWIYICWHGCHCWHSKCIL